MLRFLENVLAEHPCSTMSAPFAAAHSQAANNALYATQDTAVGFMQRPSPADASNARNAGGDAPASLNS